MDADGLLPDAAVSPIRAWLPDLAAAQASRQAVVLQTLDGAIGSLVARAPGIATSVDDQAEAIALLQADADKSFAEAVRTVGVQTADGSLLRGEVLSRWHDFVGIGEFFRAVEQKIGWLRDRLMASLAAFASGPVLGLPSLVAMGWLLWRKRWMAAAHWLGAIAVGLALTVGLGAVADMPRRGRRSGPVPVSQLNLTALPPR